MATESQRKKAIKKGIREGKQELSKIVSDRRAVIQGLIASATSKPNFAKSATVRDKLYGDIRNEYKRLNSEIDEWTLKTGTEVSKEARAFAVADLPSKTKVGTFNEFSKKHLNDIIGAINPATVDKQVAINAKIGGMYDRDIQIFRKAVTDTIAQGAVEGLTNPQMSALMQKAVKDAGALKFVDRAGRQWSADAYFGMINRTLHAQVARDSYNATATDAGFDLAVIEGGITEASLDNPSDPCSRWAGKIISLTGATKGYPTYQDALNDGMFHPNCCVPETEVDTCDLKAASRFKYSGEMIKIEFASGNSLTVTPNHKLLTDQGFTSAHTLTNGDNVLRRIKGQGLCACRPDVDRNPTTIKDVFVTLRKSLGMSAAKVPVTSKDFHGDGQFGDGDVDVIHADCLLLDDIGVKSLIEPIGKNGFVFADSELLKFSGCGPSNLFLYAMASATNRIVSGFSVGGSPLSSSQFLGNRELLLFAPDPYSCGNKGFVNSVLSNLKHFADSPVSNTGVVELDHVVGVNRFSYSGHVYDLQSLSTLYYANGYVSSNCIHFTRALLTSDIPEAKKEEKEIAAEGAEARRNVNKERKDKGLKPNKYAGTDGKAATSGR